MKKKTLTILSALLIAIGASVYFWTGNKSYLERSAKIENALDSMNNTPHTYTQEELDSIEL